MSTFLTRKVRTSVTNSRCTRFEVLTKTRYINRLLLLLLLNVLSQTCQIVYMVVCLMSCSVYTAILMFYIVSICLWCSLNINIISLLGAKSTQMKRYVLQLFTLWRAVHAACGNGKLSRLVQLSEYRGQQLLPDLAPGCENSAKHVVYSSTPTSGVKHR